MTPSTQVSEDSIRRGFGSDNHSGAHPDVILALSQVNEGHVPAYGDDVFTAKAVEVLRSHVGEDADVRFVFNGTGANVSALSALCRTFGSVICAETAHINVDECAAPEHIAGVKLVPVATPDGKLTADLVKPHLTGFGFEHHAQPSVISISNATEFGTVYTPAELRALADLAHAHGMFLHVDGARLANAAVSLGVGLADITSKAGVDALSFGGTKNGMILGEAVVLFGEARTETIPYIRKQSAQLASKSRFIAAQFMAMYEGDLWSRCASHANDMAARLAAGAAELPGVEITQSVDANEVFARLPRHLIEPLQERWRFYTWDEPSAEIRWVTSWDTTEADVDALLADARELLDA